MTGAFVPADIGDFPWELECLLCGQMADDTLAVSLAGATNALVRIQEHAMGTHGVTLQELHDCTREWSESEGHTYTLPDGRAWLRGTTREAAS